jgi:hypothetical protein
MNEPRMQQKKFSQWCHDIRPRDNVIVESLEWSLTELMLDCYKITMGLYIQTSNDRALNPHARMLGILAYTD